MTTNTETRSTALYPSTGRMPTYHAAQWRMTLPLAVRNECDAILRRAIEYGYNDEWMEICAGGDAASAMLDVALGNERAAINSMLGAIEDRALANVRQREQRAREEAEENDNDNGMPAAWWAARAA